MNSPHISYFSDLIGESKIVPNIGIRLPSEGYNICGSSLSQLPEKHSGREYVYNSILALKILNVIFKRTALSLKDYALSFIRDWKD